MARGGHDAGRRRGADGVPAQVALLAFAAVVAIGAAAATQAEEARACDVAGAQAEAALQLPPGLLRAIGRVESGRRDPSSGTLAPWPWTINANGQGRFFDDAATASATVHSLQAGGTASIDVGCFQVNLMHHPLAFRRVEDGFDPTANAAYAGAFLQSLRERLGTWEAAVAAYHSTTPERGDAYRARVFAAWNPTATPLAPPRQAGPVVIRIAGPDLSGPGSPIRVWTPVRPGAGPSNVAMPAPVGLPLAAMVPASLAPAARVDGAP